MEISSGNENHQIIIIKDANQLITLSSNFISDENRLGIIENGAVVIEEDKIVWVGKSSLIPKNYINRKSVCIIDANDKVVMPGLIDPHTHLVFAGSRENEFAERIKGVSYQEIAKRGGGILSTVTATRNASFEELLELGLKRLDRSLELGITTVEIKSGYGLDVENEIKCLKVIKKLNRNHPIDVIPTFMGAHEVPLEYKGKKEDYINLIIYEMLPKIAEEELALFCDIFCEEGVFTVEESERILNEAKRYNLIPKIHADEFVSFGGAELAGKIGAISAEHLISVSDNGIMELQKNGVIAVLLPGTSFFLGLNRYAPLFKMREVGLKIALGTDFNPGSCMTQSLPLIMTIAVSQMKMTPEEAIKAVTLNAASSLKIDSKVGSLDIGKKADILILDVPNYTYFIYYFGVNHTDKVIKNGEIVFDKKKEN